MYFLQLQLYFLHCNCNFISYNLTLFLILKCKLHILFFTLWQKCTFITVTNARFTCLSQYSHIYTLISIKHICGGIVISFWNTMVFWYIYIYINWKDCFKKTHSSDVLHHRVPGSVCVCVCVCVCVYAIDAYTPFLELVNPYCQVKRAHCSLWGKKLFTRILDRSKMLSLLLLWHYLYPNDQRLLSSLTTPHLYHILPFSIYPSAFL